LKTILLPGEIIQCEQSFIELLNNRFEYLNEDVLVIGVLKGGFYLTASITKQLHFIIRLAFIKFTQPLNCHKIILPDEEIEDKSVIVIDDIYDSGKTCQQVVNYLNASGAKDITYFHLLKRYTHSPLVESKVPLTLSFGREIDTDGFLFGYGMDDSQGHNRNSKTIYIC